MTYRILPPEPGGRRDRRLRSDARSRAMQQVAISVALVGFAAGTIASEGAESLRSPWEDQEAASADVIAPVAAADATVEVVTETVEQAIAHSSSETSDPGAKAGTRRVVQAGVPGIELVSFTVTKVNGIETERAQGISVVVTPPQNEIIAVGSLVIPQTTPAQQGSNRELGQKLAAELYGWSGDEWLCLDNLWSRESGWRHTAENKSSGAYGIPQALPGDKMASYGADWRTNPDPQIRWGLAYVQGRYATPCGAWSHFLRKNWY